MEPTLFREGEKDIDIDIYIYINEMLDPYSLENEENNVTKIYVAHYFIVNEKMKRTIVF